MDNKEKLEELYRRFEELSKKQEENRIELHQIKLELQKLSFGQSAIQNPEEKKIDETIVKENKPVSPQLQAHPRMIKIISSPKSENVQKVSSIPKVKPENQLWEDFVGSNLISKIGIVVLVIGISIGAKYAIDHNLIGPAMRIGIGFLLSFSLWGIGLFLKKKYKSFSAVLVGGGMAASYYLLFVSYSYYHFIPNGVAFGLMLVLTITAVAMALWYDLVVIAHISMVGAYSIPYLLSDGTGNPVILLIYITIINSGILWLAFKKLWNTLFYSAFILTSSVYAVLVISDHTEVISKSGLIMGLVYYAQFYLMFIVYKLRKKIEIGVEDYVLIILNNLIYFGVGLYILNHISKLENYDGLFTLLHAIINLCFAYLIYKANKQDQSLVFLMVGLFVTFITIAIPVQTNGNWLTYLWSMEGLVILAIGRWYAKYVFEVMAYVILSLAALIVVNYWVQGLFLLPNLFKQNIYSSFTNERFFESLFFSFVMIFAYKIILSTRKNQNANSLIAEVIFPLVTAITVFFTLRVELVNYFEGVMQKENLSVENFMLSNFYNVGSVNFHFGQYCLSVFSLGFYLLLFVINRTWIKEKTIEMILYVVLFLLLLVYLFKGSYHQFFIQQAWLHPDQYSETPFGTALLLIRYLSFPFAILTVYYLFSYSKISKILPTYFNLLKVLLQVVLISFLSLEYLYWMNFIDSTKSVKLGLSIVWAVYGLFIILYGIRKAEKIFRVFGLVIILLTVIKLFFIDIAQLTTLAKTTVFICLGTIMLVVSYLYNRFKNQIIPQKDE